EGTVDEAFPPMSVTVRLEDELDVSRGDVLSVPDSRPAVARSLEAHVCWMSDAPLREGQRYLLKHTTRTVKARVAALRHRIDINGVERESDATELGLNDLGRISLSLAAPVMADPYARNRTTGRRGFDAESRAASVRRAAEAGRLLADSGTVALVSLVSPYTEDRQLARTIHAGDDLPFVEVFVDTPIEECERRDPKGLYA